MSQPNFIGYEAIRALAPAAFAKEPADNVSDRYAFVSTQDIVNKLAEYDWYVVSAYQNLSKRIKDPVHATHMLTFRKLHPEQGLGSYDVGDLIPQIFYVNDHAGRKASELFSGMEKLACKNGLTIPVGLVEDEFRQIHLGDAALNVAGALSRAYTALDGAIKEITAWKQIMLDPMSMLQFATEAIKIRYPDSGNRLLNVGTLLTVRREADQKTDLWTVFNRVQENLVRGGGDTNVFSRRRRLRSVKAIKPWKAINDGLWNLARTVAAKITG